MSDERHEETRPTKPVPGLLRWSFILFSASLTWEAYDVPFLPISYSLAKSTGLLLFCVCCLYPSRSFRWTPSPFLWSLLYFAVYGLTGLSVPPWLSSIHTGQIFTMMQLVLLFWIASNLLGSERLSREVILAYALGATALALMILWDPEMAQTLTSKGEERLTSLGLNPNLLAGNLALAIVVLVGLQLVDRAKGSLLFRATILCTLPLLAVVVRTGSRAGIAAAAVGCVIYLVPHRDSTKKLAAFLLGGAATLLIVYFVARDPFAAARWRAAFSEEGSTGRGRIFAEATTMFLEKPVLGWGPVTSLYKLGDRLGYLQRQRDTHNLLLHLLLQVGLVGTIPFLIALGLCVRGAWEARHRSLRLLPLALLLTVVSINMTHVRIDQKTTWLVMALATTGLRRSAGRAGPRTPPGELESPETRQRDPRATIDRVGFRMLASTDGPPTAPES